MKVFKQFVIGSAALVAIILALAFLPGRLAGFAAATIMWLLVGVFWMERIRNRFEDHFAILLGKMMVERSYRRGDRGLTQLVNRTVGVLHSIAPHLFVFGSLLNQDVNWIKHVLDEAVYEAKNRRPEVSFGVTQDLLLGFYSGQEEVGR